MDTNTTATPPPAATVQYVTVDRITDTHRALLPVLPERGFVVALYRSGDLDLIPTLVAEDPLLVSWLHTAAAKAAKLHGCAHDLGCPYCGTGNCDNRFDHERLARTSERSWRAA